MTNAMNRRDLLKLAGMGAAVLVSKGLHYVVLDNVSDPTAAVGEPQLHWL